MSTSGGRAGPIPSPTGVGAPADAQVVSALPHVWTGAAWNAQFAATGIADADTGTVSPVVNPWVFNGATWDRQRTPKVFKQNSGTAAGEFAVWAPASGKKIRLMGYVIEVTANASLAVAGVETLQWIDGASALAMQHQLFVNNAAATTLGNWSTGVVNLGNGILSAAANNVLGVNIGTALATGVVNALAWGTEE